MKSFDIDPAVLAKLLYQDDTRIPVKGNEQRLIRVAFDLFKLRGDVKEDLWAIQADDDGNEFLVKTYTEPVEEPVKTAWTVSVDKHANFTVAYKNVPISKIATQGMKIETSKDVETLRQIIQTKLAADKNFFNKYVKGLPEIKRALLKEAMTPEEKIFDEWGAEIPADEPIDFSDVFDAIRTENKLREDAGTPPPDVEQDSKDESPEELWERENREDTENMSDAELGHIGETLEDALKDVPSDLHLPDMLTSVKDANLKAFVKWALELGKTYTADPEKPVWDADLEQYDEKTVRNNPNYKSPDTSTSVSGKIDAERKKRIDEQKQALLGMPSTCPICEKGLTIIGNDCICKDHGINPHKKSPYLQKLLKKEDELLSLPYDRPIARLLKIIQQEFKKKQNKSKK